MKRTSFFALSLALATPCFADGPNILVNADFSKFTSMENLWDGVDAQNCLSGNKQGTYALTESGKVGSLPVPVTPTLIDVNGDKLPDLVTCDGDGIVRAYINGGTKTEPKFTHAE